MKALLKFASIAVIAEMLSFSFLAGTATAEQNADPQQKAGHGSLGIVVSAVPRVLANNLPQLLGQGQGLMVTELAANSPAARAGIQVQDILTNYDDQKLVSREQLANLVYWDQPGREVTIGYIRQGNPEKAHVKLAEAPTLTNLGNNRFRAEFEWVDKVGKTRRQTLEGTREEIREAIRSEKDMKPAEQAWIVLKLRLPSSEERIQVAYGTGFRPGSASVFLHSANNNLSLLTHYFEKGAVVPKKTVEEHIREAERQLVALKDEYAKLGNESNVVTTRNAHAKAVMASAELATQQLADLRRELESGDVAPQRIQTEIEAISTQLETAAIEHYQFYFDLMQQSRQQNLQQSAPTQRPWYPRGLDPNGPSYDPELPS